MLVSGQVDSVHEGDDMSELLPEDPEDALNMLGVLAQREAKSTARAKADVTCAADI